MNKIKHIAIAISALSTMSAASISLASNCPTSISPATSQCLSTSADAAFQQNYANDYQKQKAGLGGAYYYGGNTGNTNSNANYSAPRLQTQQTTQSQSSYFNTNNDNSNRKPIRWY